MQVTITRDAYETLWQYIKQCNQEISGLGKVREISEGVLEVYAIETFRQQVSGTHSTIDDDALAEFISGKISAGEDVSEYKVWWHSHVNMQAFFSGTDTGTIDMSREFPYLVSIVGNKKAEFSVRVDIYSPLRFTQKDLKLELSEDQEIIDLVASEIAEKIRFTPLIPPAVLPSHLPEKPKLLDSDKYDPDWLDPQEEDMDDIIIPKKGWEGWRK